jgi:hypothetical protein
MVCLSVVVGEQGSGFSVHVWQQGDGGLHALLRGAGLGVIREPHQELQRVVELRVRVIAIQAALDAGLNLGPTP